MRDSKELLEKSLKDYYNSKTVQSQLLDLVENLHKNLEAERSSTSLLQNKIEEITKQDNFAITSKLTKLRGEYNALREKLTILKCENEDLNIQLIAKSQESNQLLAQKEEELNLFYTAQLKEKDKEIKQKEMELIKLQEKIKQKEQQLCNELQAVEVSSNIELETVKDEFQKQLTESNKRLKDSMDTCNVIRLELMSIKEQFIEYKRSSTEKISELRKQLQHDQNADDNILSSKENSSSPNQTESDEIANILSKYQPLDVTNSTKSGLSGSKKVPVYRGSVRYVLDSPESTKNLPPLVPLKEIKSGGRKRKLYNPDDLSYLINMEEND